MEQVTIDIETPTVRELFGRGEAALVACGIDDARMNAELLLAHVLRSPRGVLRSRLDEPVHKAHVTEFQSVIERRSQREPLQYILGTVDFMGLILRVDRRVLIPRPETELLVDEVLRSADRTGRMAILDIGTGSGNIALALAKYLPSAVVDSVDISHDALALARENASTLAFGGSVRFIEGDILDASWQPPLPAYDVIVSNPPYVSEEEYRMCQPEIQQYEPACAVTDSSDGLTFFRRIAAIAGKVLEKRGNVFVETAYDQHEAVKEIFARAGFAEIACRNDYAGVPRCLTFSR